MFLLARPARRKLLLGILGGAAWYNHGYYYAAMAAVKDGHAGNKIASVTAFSVAAFPNSHPTTSRRPRESSLH
jgi:hypothetical protein